MEFVSWGAEVQIYYQIPIHTILRQWLMYKILINHKKVEDNFNLTITIVATIYYLSRYLKSQLTHSTTIFFELGRIALRISVAR